MTPHRPSGWNTWDYRGFNRFTLLEEGRPRLTVQVAMWDPSVPPPAPDSKQIGRLYRDFRWSDVPRVGRHGPLGLPAELEFTAGPGRYALSADDADGGLRLAVRPLTAAGQRVVFLLAAAPEQPVRRRGPDSGTVGGLEVDLAGAAWPHDYFLNLDLPYAIAPPDEPATITIRSGPAGQQPPAVEASGALGELPRAMLDVLYWNTLYDWRRGLVISPVCRDWCIDWRGPIVFCWDTFFAALTASYESPELARFNFEAALAAVDELGFVPNYYMAHGAASLDRSMPPLGAHYIWKTQAPQPDVAWLAEVYPRLRRWHAFWTGHRAGSAPGLLAWGSNAEPVYDFPELVPYNPTLRHSDRAARWESGLDNSPMYDDVEFDPQAQTLRLDDVGLTSYYALDCEALAHIAACLGRDAEAAAYRDEYARVARAVNEYLWDEQSGIYCNRHFDGRLSRRWSPTSLFPLLAGLAPRQRAERLLREHLLNPDEFWGRWVIPSIARHDPAYHDNDYWRGRIWGPFNLLVAEGLRRYRFDRAAAELAEKSLHLFAESWRRDGGVYENYNAETGAGGDVWNAARLYHWGGLLVALAIGELIDVEPAGWLRFGSRHFPAAAIENVHVAGRRYDVRLDETLHVVCDGKPLLECSTRAAVRVPLAHSESPVLEIDPARPGRLTIFEPAAAWPARVGDRRVMPRRDGSRAVYEW